MRIDELLARRELGQVEQQHPPFRDRHAFNFAGVG
jgi:hypothetical protein